MYYRGVSRPVLLAAGIALVVLGIACSREAAGPVVRDADREPALARTVTSTVGITSISPDSAGLATTLDVTVNGSGFTTGMVAQWQLAGVADSTQVKTNSTRYVSSKQLVANITISGSASTTSWDVAIYSGGKTGVGSELGILKQAFRVLDPRGAFYLANETGFNLQGDALSAYLEGSSSAFAGTSRYRDAECGVQAWIYATSGESGDAILSMAGTQDRKCAAYPRKVRITYERINADGSTTAEGSVTRTTWLNVRKLERGAYNGDPGLYIPVGSTAQRTLNFSDDGNKCGTAGVTAIAFVPLTQTGINTGADMVSVYRNDAATWTVTTQADEMNLATGQTTHHDKAYCAGNLQLYHMPLRLTIRMNTPVFP